MISITTKTTEGTVTGVLFQEAHDSELRNETSRVFRTPTLDGGAVVDHRGFSDGDRTFKIKAKLDEDTADDLWYLFRTETLLNISCSEGFFEGAISDMKAPNGNLELTFLVKE